MDIWLAFNIPLAAMILITVFHMLMALFRKVELHSGGSGFEDAPEFSDGGRLKLTEHYSRMQGTLGFWKNQAALYGRLHKWAVMWSISSGVMM